MGSVGATRIRVSNEAVLIARGRAAKLLVATALAIPLLSVQAHAQAAPHTDDTDMGSEIIVTAQRRAERLEDVPAAITVVSGNTLENAGVTNFQELGQVAAGAQVNFAGAFTQPTIRGITTLTNGNNVENNVAVYVDGFYEPSALVINADLPNLAGIEVLKGPQGTLYGRNATGGAILINTLAPSAEWTGKAQLTYARFNDKRASAYVSGPLADSVRIGLAGYYRHTDSYIRLANPAVIGGKLGPATPIRQAAVRLKLEADLASNLKATLGYNMVHVDDGRTDIFTPYARVSPALPAPPLRATEPYTASFNGVTESPVTNHQGTLKLALATGIGTITSYTGYTDSKQHLEFDFDGTYVNSTIIDINFHQKTFQQAVDYNIDAIDGLNLIVGGMYYHDDIATDPVNRTLIGGVVAQRTIGGVKSDAWAAYADATLELAQGLSLSLGGRYSHDKKDNDYRVFSAAGAIVTDAAAKDSWSKFTPRAALRYEIAPRTNVYASWSRGYRTGTFNFTPPAIVSEWRAVVPETISAYEVGFKTAQDGYRFDMAGFYYDYRNLQVATLLRSPLCAPVPAPPALDTCNQFLNVYQNAPKARVYGIDGQFSATPVENLNLRLGFAWLNAKYTDFRDAVGTGLNAATGLNVNNQVQDWSGQQMARAPELSGNAGFDYLVPQGEGGLRLAANVSYTSSFVVNNPALFGPLAGAAVASQQRYRQGGYALVNASLTWTEPSGHLHVTVFGRNLTNHRYFITKTGSSNGDYGTLAEPVTYGVKLGFDF
ncbi:TonB-dependent receptor [Novosphingobium sp. PS1R-30]|uniref:TonB-dependent receptor n=1 Tax=Novosphingobium anseongense TaxID=3133436 RepID=A0ABU8S1Q7_9SPHN